MTDDEICGAECADGTPCEHPAGSCPVPSHNADDVETNPQGRPAAFDEEWRRDALYEAVSLGMKLHHQAGFAQVSENTVRRSLCCVDTPSEPVLVVDDPCDFCQGYVRAHSEGASEVLQNCSDEFVASAAYGYKKTDQHEHVGEGGGPVEVNLTETIYETGYDE